MRSYFYSWKGSELDIFNFFFNIQILSLFNNTYTHKKRQLIPETLHLLITLMKILNTCTYHICMFIFKTSIHINDNKLNKFFSLACLVPKVSRELKTLSHKLFGKPSIGSRRQKTMKIHETVTRNRITKRTTRVTGLSRPPHRITR